MACVDAYKAIYRFLVGGIYSDGYYHSSAFFLPFFGAFFGTFLATAPALKDSTLTSLAFHKYHIYKPVRVRMGEPEDVVMVGTYSCKD